MNIQPVNSTTPKINHNMSKQNVAFGSYSSVIDKNSLKRAINSINDVSPMLDKAGVTSLSSRLWNTLESIKNTYAASKVVAVHTFVEVDNVWAIVGTTPEVTSKQLLGGWAQHNSKPLREYIISGGENLKKQIDTHAEGLIAKYKDLV